MQSKIVIFKGKNKQWYFNIKASNGKIIATSEGYKQKASLIKGIKSVQKSVPKAKIVERY